MGFLQLAFIAVEADEWNSSDSSATVKRRIESPFPGLLMLKVREPVRRRGLWETTLKLLLVGLPSSPISLKGQAPNGLLQSFVTGSIIGLSTDCVI